MLAAALLPTPALALPREGEAGYIASSSDLGRSGARCRAGEKGPAVLVMIAGLKDRKGTLRAELYPPDDPDFLNDDNILLMEGKTFRRIDEPLPASGPVMLCMRLPGPGNYTMSILHDRDDNRKFGLSGDGIGFPNNPRLGLSKPKAAMARFAAGLGLTSFTVRLNYRRGLFSFGPLDR
jgi:uncharacterized protein (DUF2141 family)